MCYSAMIEQDEKILADLFDSESILSDWSGFEKMRSQPEMAVPPLSNRVFPGYYAPVLTVEDGRLVTRLMRYSIDPPGFVKDGKRDTAYNARLDNLESSFWGESFRHHHGLILMRGFFEWVAVKDLVKAGHISMEQIEQEFDRQKAERKMRLKQAGKAYKPTRTELTEAAFRKVVIFFKPEPEQELLVPVIFSKRTGPSGISRFGFAIVTDDPPPAVAVTGHDRCPIFLDRPSADVWLRHQPFSAVSELKAILGQRPSLSLSHELDRAA